MKTFYFTATGNSLYVAKEIGGELCSIPQMLNNKSNQFEDEAIGFVFPCYCFGIPRIVLDFLTKSNFTAKYFFAVITCGTFTASTIKQLETLALQKGITFNYTNEIVMIDNYLPLFEINNQLKKQISKNINENLAKIVNDIKQRKEKKIKKDLASDLASKVLYNLSAPFIYDNVDKSFSVNEKCINCKLCEKVCPANNIKVDKEPKFMHKCEGCLACIHHCPENALHMKYERSSVRFINQNVNLNEIINANNQK